MGEASRRRAANKAWLSSLSGDAKIVAETAIKLHDAMPMEGACYRMTFFMRQYLRERHSINAEAVVGFVNDGTDNLYASHAWLEFEGKKIDLTLTRPLRPELQKRGPVLVLDWVYAPGWGGYTYHRSRPAIALAELTQLMQHEDARGFVEQAEALHLAMRARSRSDAQIEAYLANAPDGLDYPRTAELLERTPIR